MDALIHALLSIAANLVASQRPSVITPAFQNGWVNYDATLFPPAGYFIDQFGIVHLQGLVKSGTTGATFPIFTLPSGFRPKLQIHFPVSSNALYGQIEVKPGGEVVLTVGSNVWVSLSTVQFRAEQ